ncbi:MAG: hypothetical protein ACLFN8_00450 [Candidatus Woesearchaeota archaeon]
MVQKSSEHNLESHLNTEQPIFLGRVKKVQEIKKEEIFNILYEDYYTKEEKQTQIKFKIHPQIINSYILRGSLQQINEKTSYVLELIDEKKLEGHIQKTKKTNQFKTEKSTDYGCFFRYVVPINGM